MGTKIVVLDEINKFLAVSLDNTKYILLDKVSDCFLLNHLTICRELVTYSTFNNRNCLTNIFYDKTDVDCQYKNVHQVFDAHNNIDSALILFSATGVQVQFNCNKTAEMKVLKGSFLLDVPINCNVNSSFFSFQQKLSDVEINLTNIIPRITCCSKFYKLNSSTYANSTIKLKSLHDIRKIDSTSLTSKLNNWKKFRNINFEKHVNATNVSLTMIVICVIVGLIFWKRCVDSCKKNETNITVAFTPENIDEDRREFMRRGYPAFS